MNIYHFKCLTCGSRWSYQEPQDALDRLVSHTDDNNHQAEVYEEVDYQNGLVAKWDCSYSGISGNIWKGA